MSDMESLVKSRTRRANAGSRLKQLIELEESASGIKQALLSEDDENVQLLFQEDDNDAEFEEDEEEEEGDNDESEDEGQEETENDSQKVPDRVPDEDMLNPQKEAEELLRDNEDSEQAAVNSDDVLSESDLSVSENDDSEGERELEKEERAKKRKTKQKVVIPAIKRPKVATEKKPLKKPDFSSDAFLYSTRRSSSRKSAVQNKQALLEKLKQDETRRASFSPVVRVKERDLTQEERLAQALETEKANTLSLHAFLEQEIVKKERQKMMLQQRKVKLRNVVRLSSFATFISPLDEIEDARHVQDLFDRKKRGRRRKAIVEDPDVKRPGDIDTELPYYKQEMAEKKRIEEEKAEEKRKLEEARAEKRQKLEQRREERRKLLEEEREERRRVKMERLQEFENVDVTHPNYDADLQALKDEIKHLETPLPEDYDAEPQDHDEDEHEANEDKKQDNDAMDVEEQEPEKDVVTIADNEEVHEEETPQGSGARDTEFKTESMTSANQDSDNKDQSLAVLMSPREEKEPRENGGRSSPEPASELEPSEQKQELAEAKAITDKAIESGQAEGELRATREAPENEHNNVSEKEEDQQITNKDSEPPSEVVSDDRAKSESVKVEGDNQLKVEKKVTFEDNIEGTEEKETPQIKDEEYEDVKKETDDPRPESSLFYRPGPNGAVYEGPVQFVSRNMVYLVDFDEEERTWRLPESTIKVALFGEGSLLGASRRFKDVETILRSTTRNENPYATTKEEKEDELYQPVTEITEENSMFDDLKRLHKLGVRVEDEEEEEEELKEEENVVNIKTEAPTGLYLPNGNKKICLISGKEVRYFDPSTGVPYDSVEDYKVIKSIEAGAIPWYSISKDQNTYGAAEIYLNSREGSRHAKGVPEGFDGC